MIEGEGDGAVLDLHGCVTWAERVDWIAVIVGECEPDQAIGDGGFIAWMDIASFAGINDHRLPGIGQCEGHCLCFTQFGPSTVAWLGGFCHVVGELHPVERKVALLPEVAPRTYH